MKFDCITRQELTPSEVLDCWGCSINGIVSGDTRTGVCKIFLMPYGGKIPHQDGNGDRITLEVQFAAPLTLKPLNEDARIAIEKALQDELESEADQPQVVYHGPE